MVAAAAAAAAALLLHHHHHLLLLLLLRVFLFFSPFWFPFWFPWLLDGSVTLRAAAFLPLRIIERFLPGPRGTNFAQRWAVNRS